MTGLYHRKWLDSEIERFSMLDVFYADATMIYIFGHVLLASLDVLLSHQKPSQNLYIFSSYLKLLGLHQEQESTV